MGREPLLSFLRKVCRITQAKGPIKNNKKDLSGLLGNVTTYYDYAAPGEPGFYPGNAGATKGTIVEYVGLTLSGSYQYPSPSHEYKVVAINSYGTSSFSNTASGNKVLGARTYQWQRSAGDSNASYSNILGATSTSHNDTGAPADGSGRYYRCVENGVGGAQQISVVDRGYRKLPLIPIVYTYDASEINVSSCIGNGYIGGIGDTNVTRVGFYYLKGTDGTPGPLNPDSLEVGTDVNYGIPTLYQKPITGLVSGAPYRIRAYAINTIGTAYGDTIQIFTKFIPQISWLL